MKLSTYLKTIFILGCLVVGIHTVQAQVFPRSYINVDWQLNVPIHTDFADNTSGWGMNFEGGYFLTSNYSIGAFIGYHTNFENIPRQTLSFDDGTALTATQKHALYQLPFGVTSRYTWRKKCVFQPYAGLKLGANYAEMSSYYYIIKQYSDTWGFYLSPEVGFTVFPDPSYRMGIHMAMYFAAATNSGSVLGYRMENPCQFGLRFGVSF